MNDQQRADRHGPQPQPQPHRGASSVFQHYVPSNAVDGNSWDAAQVSELQIFPQPAPDSGAVCFIVNGGWFAQSAEIFAYG